MLFPCLATMVLASCINNAPVNHDKSTNYLPYNVLHPVGKVVTIKKIKDFSILIPEKATAQEKFSAAMLNDYLSKIFKIKIPIVREPGLIKGNFFSIGDTSRAATAGITHDPREQAYKLALSDGNLYILGGTRGPIYGVIALLEEDLGCRWYAVDDTPVVPVRSTDELTVVPRSYAPPFEVREPLYSDAFNTLWATFNRIQPISPYTIIPLEAGGGLANSNYFIHTYDRLVPADKYFASHPEYFPLRGGKRVPSKQTNGQLCYTSPGVVKVMVETLEAEIVKNPGSRIYSVSANDNVNTNCECPSCQKIIKADGIPGIQLYLANEVANKLAVKYPEIKITTLAYIGSQKPPKTIKPGPNTVIFYAPVYQRINSISMLLPIGEIKQIADELAEWHQISSNIYLWDYMDLICDTPKPFPNFDAQEGGWQFLINNGVTGVFLQGCYLGHGSLGELKSWLYAKKLWNPQWPQHAMIAEFVTSYYGPAAAEMVKYVSLQQQAWSHFYRNFKPGIGLKFSNPEIEQMYKLLNSAMVRCGDQSSYQVRIERELLTLLCLSLSDNPRPSTAADYSAKLKQAEELITKLKIENFGEGISVDYQLRVWRKKLKRGTGCNEFPQYSKKSITVKEPACPLAQYLPDADATLAHATRQAGGNVDWGVQWNYSDFLDLLEPGTIYIVRMLVKSEFKAIPKKPGALFIFNSYTINGATPGSSGSGFTGNFSACDNGLYHWIELGKLQVITPGAVGYLYCVPGELSEKDAVWYDYLEFIPENEFNEKERVGKLPLIKI